MHMTEKSHMPQSARMRAQIQANTGNFGRQRFSLHGVDLTKFDGGCEVDPWDQTGALARRSVSYKNRLLKLLWYVGRARSMVRLFFVEF